MSFLFSVFPRTKQIILKELEMDKAEREKRWANGAGYDRYIQEELASFRKEAWKKQIRGHLGGRTGLKVLDIGTGPGFFACILSEEGHAVTGIDSSEGMLEKARINADRLGVSPSFVKMDINALDFPDQTFDLIVSRNVTWTLEHPAEVYTELKRVLKDGGILLIYDANWHLHFYDEELMKKVRAREEAHLKKYGTREIVSNDDMEYYLTAPLTHTQRPEWDIRILNNLGMDVTVQEDIGQWLYEQWEKELYAESPLFEICAVKGTSHATEHKMRTYWQKRAESFGFDKEGDSVQAMQERLKRYLPEKKLRILDVGTGTGMLAVSLALMGHQVTAVDLCTNMIARASDNAKACGVQIDFYCTKADELPFSDDTFDVVVCRNLLWALQEPEQALLQWKRVLKSGGILLYLDGNHYYYQYHDEDRLNRQRFTELNGSPYLHDPANLDYSLCDNTAYDLPLSRLDRPAAWDDKILPELGFHICAEEILRPQAFLKFGIARGYYTEFLIAALNGE